MINIDELTFGQIKQIGQIAGCVNAIKAEQPQTDIFFKIGEKYLVQTVTHYFTGELTAFNQQELLLSKAAWIADTGRFMQAVASSDFNEVEPFAGPVLVSRSAMICATVISKTPNSQK